MKRCIELAKHAEGFTAPNPLVGCVIVHDNKIIGEGFHRQYGGAHAEVNAINSINIEDDHLLIASKLYVNLEPCSHFGKTPPCSDLIIQKKIPEIFIGSKDPNPLVSGVGIKKLQEANCKVTTGILGKECSELNKRFFTFHQQQRPYILLKWAQSADGYMGRQNENIRISNKLTEELTHKWRSQEQAVAVGYNTAATDNPKLNVRHWVGKNPVKIVFDKENNLSENLNIFDNSSSTFIFNSLVNKKEGKSEWIKIDFKNLAEEALKALYIKGILSILIEGGSKTLQQFIDSNLWDEIRIFHSPVILKDGIKAPKYGGKTIVNERLRNNQLLIIHSLQ